MKKVHLSEKEILKIPSGFNVTHLPAIRMFTGRFDIVEGWKRIDGDMLESYIEALGAVRYIDLTDYVSYVEKENKKRFKKKLKHDHQEYTASTQCAACANLEQLEPTFMGFIRWYETNNTRKPD